MREIFCVKEIENMEEDGERLKEFRKKIGSLQKKELKRIEEAEEEIPDKNLMDFLEIDPARLGNIDMEAFEALEELRDVMDKGLSEDGLNGWKMKFSNIYEKGEKLERELPKEKLSDVVDNRKTSRRAYSVPFKGYISSKVSEILHKIDLNLQKKI